MAMKIRSKLIMELHEQGLSGRKIIRTGRMSMDSVSEFFDIASDRGITWVGVKDMPDDDAYRCSTQASTCVRACSRGLTVATCTPRWLRPA